MGTHVLFWAHATKSQTISRTSESEIQHMAMLIKKVKSNTIK